MKLGSLCTGYGGLDRAAVELFAAEPVWVADPAPGPAALLAHHLPGIPNLGDVTAVNWADVEPVEVLTAGYPCQPFSHAGNRRGTADERHIWPWIAEAVRTLRPRHVFLENVAGHRSMGFGDVLADLATARYDARWASVRASDVGAPHRRERVFILATDTDNIGCQRVGVSRNRREGPADNDRLVVNPASPRSQGPGQPTGACQGPSGAHIRRRLAPGHGDAGDARRPEWGRWGPAIRRWERILDRAAPDPTEPGRTGRPTLSPTFVEWMMGLPAGWVTGVPGISRSGQITLLGNGVVPQQALFAAELCRRPVGTNMPVAL